VVATTPVELLVIGRRRFWAMLEGSPTLLRKVLVDLAGRLHDLDAADTKARLARSGPGSS
jgi:CRP-like cAMP-binding protein